RRVVAIRSEALAAYSGDGYAAAIVPKLRELAPAAILMPHTALGRDLAPRIAQLLDVGMVSDATELHFEDGRLGATKPVFAGKAWQKSFATRSPFMATLRPNAFEPASGDGAEVVDAPASIDPASLGAVVREVIAG